MYFGSLTGTNPECGNIQSGGNTNKFPFFGVIVLLINFVSPPLFTSFKYHKKDKYRLEVELSTTST
jgi:hypothetical protein